MQQQNDGVFIVPVMLSLLFCIAVICIFVWFLSGGPAKGADNITLAYADGSCLNKEQARAKWPKDYLYWHGINHCWDNVRSYATPDRRGKGGKLQPKQLDPSGNNIEHLPPPPKERRASVYYPTLMSGGGTADNMLTPGSMMMWPLVADFDTEPVPFLPWQRISALLNR